MGSRCHTHRNDVATLVLNHYPHPHPHHPHPHPHHHHNNHHFRLWNSFAASIRRKLIATIICGGGCSPSSSHSHSQTPSKPNIKPDPNTHTDKKLADLLNLSHSCSSSMSIKEEDEEEVEEEEVKRKEQRMEELRGAVRTLQSELMEERENGAKLIRKMGKEDVEARSTLAMMGAIPPLVAMIRVHDDEETESQIQALYALLNLGIGNDLNKAAIVQAGAVDNMLKKIESSNGSLESAVPEAIVANFLALSALDSNKPIIGASGAIPFLVSVLKDSNKKCSPQARQDALRALYNLSISPSNIATFLETDFIPYLISTLGDMEVSERILAILSNIVSSSEGRRAISSVPDVFPVLIDVLNWTDSPGCQEKASYVLMVMAHRSYTDRQRMIEAGIGSALLELTLLGSTLAQKRASRILECLRVKQGSHRLNVNGSTAVSAPIYGSSSSTTNISFDEEEMISEEKKAVKQLVQQSLQNNMKRIVKRANLPQDFVPSEHLKSLTISSTSKSLPF